ncbi:MAG: tRNA 2-thiocytidine(32) synthetase TtcA [Spirochaetes bacterium]|nr:tRNA 2-thiocytidine(32) synthetase TtcA [Spirochaetota bacterium]
MTQNNRFFRKINKIIGQTIYDYHLIETGDKILIGLSGGKDSLTLADILAEKRKHLPVKFTLHACYVEMGSLGHKIDSEILKDFCEKRDITFIHKKVSPDFNLEPEKDKCFICSWHRRKTLFNTAREIEAKKLALGHHMDDIIETFLINFSFQGNISTMPVKLSLFDEDLFIIRPLAGVKEESIIKYAELKNMTIQKENCTYGATQSRQSMKPIIEDFIKLNPMFKESVFKALHNIKSDYLL